MYIIKFDRAFLLESFSSKLGRVLIESMLLICQRHGIKTVAEGVERPDQLAFLREHGCDAIQGDLLAPAMPAEAYEHLLAQRETCRICVKIIGFLASGSCPFGVSRL